MTGYAQMVAALDEVDTALQVAPKRGTGGAGEQFHMDRPTLEAAYATLYEQYEVLEGLEEEVKAKSAAFEPHQTSPQLKACRAASENAKKAFEDTLLARIYTLETEIVRVLDGMKDAWTNMGVTDAEKAAELRRAGAIGAPPAPSPRSSGGRMIPLPE